MVQTLLLVIINHWQLNDQSIYHQSNELTAVIRRGRIAIKTCKIRRNKQIKQSNIITLNHGRDY